MSYRSVLMVSCHSGQVAATVVPKRLIRHLLTLILWHHTGLIMTSLLQVSIGLVGQFSALPCGFDETHMQNAETGKHGILSVTVVCSQYNTGYGILNFFLAGITSHQILMYVWVLMCR